MNNRKTIGILGGGQLARMSAYQAYKLGYNVAILEKEKNSPAGQITKFDFDGWVNNKESIKKFISVSDVITLENEFIDSSHLKFIESLGKKVYPSSKTISLIQDKFIQKKTLQKNKIPVPNFVEVKSNSTYNQIAKKLGNKFLLKSRKMGYDGYGNSLVTDENSFIEGIKKLTSRHSELMAEEFISFNKELAIMVVRTLKEIRTYPVVETIQKNHICHLVIAPAEINKNLYYKIIDIAIEAVKSVNGYGIFGIELFLTKENNLLLNEMAPRPHNSGHYTIEGCYTSQFENHIRAVLNLPLGSTEMREDFAVMINLLGKKNGKAIPEKIEETLRKEKIFLHLYGKEESRLGRKMGHITLTGKDRNQLIKKAIETEKNFIL